MQVTGNRVVAFLQNQWFKNPKHVRRIYAEHAGDMDRRARLNARFLFYKSLTGRRLRDAFGSLCATIVWEESSPEIGGESSARFNIDRVHILRVLEHFEPRIVLGFGGPAVAELHHMANAGAPWRLICGPHPAARQATVPEQLRAMAERLSESIVEFGMVPHA
jgi:hypothetical protein